MLWTPDTCGVGFHEACQFEHTWDEATQTDNFDSTVRVCANHQIIGLLPGKAHWEWVLDENKRKNNVFNIAQAVRPLNYDENYTWTFDVARVLLTVSFPGAAFNVSQRAEIRAACDLQFGTGKVLVT